MEPIRLRGFTLIELMVVAAIILVLSVVVLVRQSSFNNTVLLVNTAYDVALTLRDAETFGIGSRGANSSPNVGYGIHFDKNARSTLTFFSDIYPAPAAPPTTNCHPGKLDPSSGLLLPGARPGNCAYDANQFEKVTDYTLGNGVLIARICAVHDDASIECALGLGGQALTTLDIVFTRPNSEPFISKDGVYDPTIAKACIAFGPQQGGTPRYVSVTKTGQIAESNIVCTSL